MVTMDEGGNSIQNGVKFEFVHPYSGDNGDIKITSVFLIIKGSPKINTYAQKQPVLEASKRQNENMF